NGKRNEWRQKRRGQHKRLNLNEEHEMLVNESSVVVAKAASIVMFFTEDEGKEQRWGLDNHQRSKRKVNSQLKDYEIPMDNNASILYHSFFHKVANELGWVLSYNELKINRGFERAIAILFEQDVQTFTCLMILHLDQLEKQLGKEEFQETGSMDAFIALKTQFQLLINFQYNFDGFDDLMIRKYFLAYTRTETQKSKVVLGKALDNDLVVMENNVTESGKQDISSSSGNYITHDVDADIRPVNDQVPFVEVQLTTQHNVLAIEQ
ncbi:hypothetical protein Tco_0881424, partial [Tanacetum coccineum]